LLSFEKIGDTIASPTCYNVSHGGKEKNEMIDRAQPAAFPQSAPTDEVEEWGMTLWDWYAGQALIGLLASPFPGHGPNARRAFDLADAMMERHSELLNEQRERRVNGGKV